jgi:hypothetical protein
LSEEVAARVPTVEITITDQVPEEAWYWAALDSIIASATLFIFRQRDWSILVGQLNTYII